MSPDEIEKLFLARGHTIIKNPSVDPEILNADICWSTAIDDPEITRVLVSIGGADGIPYIRTKLCRSSTSLMTMGGIDQSLYLLNHGLLEISTLDDENIQIKAQEWIGERFFADIFRGRTANVVSVERTQLIEINSALFEVTPKLQVYFKDLIIQIMDRKIGALYRQFAEMKKEMSKTHG
jgi:hypothetical protein